MTGAAFADRLRSPRFGDRLRALVRGRAEDAAWVRPALIGLVLATTLLYVVDLASSGWANAYYSAAVQAGSSSWKAFFFGSFDSSSFITVDKPPASLWVMDLSARIFGVSSWSILLPQALEGVAAVGLLYATVRRRFGPGAGLTAGAVLALTPIAVLMFRFNNPDSLLTLVLVGAAYALTRALERGSTAWLALAGSLVGVGFLTKMLQALIVVPGFALIYLLAAPTPLRRRLVQLTVSGVALVASAGWWVAAVALWPAGSRPYIGSSQTNSILDLIFGYNGLGRLSGDESGSVVGGGRTPGAGAWGPTGLWRLFGSEMGTQASWLIPSALVLGASCLWLRRRTPRTDGRRAAVLVWGSWLVVTGLVLSFAQGIIHPYYTVVLAPAIGALVGAGASEAWLQRGRLAARLGLLAALAAAVAWSWVLLERTPDWQPWLRWAILVAGVLAFAGLLAGRSRAVVRSAAVAAAVAALAAPAAYAVQTASTAHSGALPTAGPAGASRQGGRVGFGGPGGGVRRAGGPGTNGFGGGFAPQPGLTVPQGVTPAQGFGGGPVNGGGFNRGGLGRAGGGGIGGLLDASTPSSALVAQLKAGAGSYRWVAATVGANSAAGIQLATGEPVMAIGGFNGSDPSTTLAQFKAYVRAGAVHWFIGGGGGGGFGGGGGSSDASAIESWVTSTFRSVTVGGVTIYDLTSPRG